MDNENLYEMAIKTWGKDAQLLMAIEENSELIKQICKYMNRGGLWGKVEEETADVEIMCEQIRRMYPNASANIDAIKKEKLARLKERLDEYS